MKRIQPVRDDIINHRRLAAETPATPLRLEYRSQPKTADEEHRFAVSFLTAATLVVGLLVMTMHTVGDYLLLPAVIASCASVGFTVAVVLAIRGARLWIPLAVLAGGPLLPVMLALLHYATRLSSLIVVVALTALALATWCLHLMAAHQARWLATGPRVKHDRLAAWREAWSGPWLWKPKGPTRLHGLYPIALGVAGYFVFHFGALGGDASIGIILLGTVVALLALGVSNPDSRSVVTGFGRRLANWLSYGAGQVKAPGVFQSPAGGPLKRRILTVAVLFLLSSATLVSSGFWAVFVQQDPAPWRALFTKVISEKASATGAFAASRNFELEKLPPVELKPLPNEKPAEFKLRRDAEEKRIREAWENNQFRRFLQVEPSAWAWLALDGLGTGDVRYVWALLTAALLTLLYPVTSLVISTGLILGFVELAVGRDIQKHASPETGADGQTDWSVYRGRLENSDNPLERNHLWLGAHAYDDYPLMLHESILSEHAYISGDSGSGKTALGLTSLLTQLIDRGNAPVVILDLKGDMDLFQAVRARSGDSFRFFTVERGRSTHTFNPFRQGTNKVLTLNQVVETILESLHLNHGPGYGKSYFSRMARWFLSTVLRRKPDVATFTELFEEARRNDGSGESKGREQAEELLAVIESLTSFEQLNITAQSRRYAKAVLDSAIHMPRVFADNQVVYFWLPSVLESASVAEIAKLAIYAMLQTGFMHLRKHGVAKQAYLAIDEFQRIASSNFKVVLEQARSFGIGTILANQTIADLNTPDVDLRPTVQANTRVKLSFSASDPEHQDALMQGSGEAVDYRYSVSYSDNGTSESFSEFTRPRLQRNDIIRGSDDPTQGILQIHRGSGYSQLSGFSVPIRMSYTMTAEQRAELRRLGWPDDEPGTIKVARSPLSVERDHEKRIEVGKAVIAKANAEQPSKPVDFGVEIEALRNAGTELESSSEFARYGGPHD